MSKSTNLSSPSAITFMKLSVAVITFGLKSNETTLKLLELNVNLFI